MKNIRVLEYLLHIKNTDFLRLSSLILLTTSGIQTLFLLNRDLFHSLDIFKLFILFWTVGIVITMPIFLALSLNLAGKFNKRKKTFPVNFYFNILVAAVTTSFVINTVALILSKIIGISFGSYLMFMIILESGVVFLYATGDSDIN